MAVVSGGKVGVKDVAVYYYYPLLEQVRTRVSQAGLAIMRAQY